MKWLGRAARYEPVMRPILKSHGLPEDTVYLAMIESGFSPFAYSWARACGPWQFIAATGKRFGLKIDFWVDERRDPVKSTHAAARYLAELHGQFGHWHLAWAGYNAGGGRVARAIRRHGTTDFWAMTRGRVLRRETRHYVPKLIAAALIAKHPREFGFTEAEIVPQPALAFDEVPVVDAVDLEIVSRAAGVSIDEVRELNPHLRRWCTPPRGAADPFLLRVPLGTRERFRAVLATLSPHDRLHFKRHVVQRGDTLSAIALRYGSVPEAIMRINGIRDSRRLRLGSDLMVPVPARAKSAAAAREAQGRLAAHSRRRGFTSAPQEQEVPAGTVRPQVAAAGSVRFEKSGDLVVVRYGVAQGDTLWAIAQRFGVTVEQIRRWNGLSRRRAALQVGRELVLHPPAGFDRAPHAVAGSGSVSGSMPQPLP